MTQETGAPTDRADPLRRALDDRERATLAAIADHLIPAAGRHAIGGRRPRRRPAAVRPAAPARTWSSRSGQRCGRTSATTSQARLEALGRDEPANLSALQLAIVAGYYTDKRVRELIGYPGQMALELRSWEYPAYLEEGLIDAVLARGPVWRDPSTGQRAVVADAPRTYAERFGGGRRGARRRTVMAAHRP